MGRVPGVPGPIPVVEVNSANWAELQPLVFKAVQTASFVAVDFELSGIGASRDLGHPNVEERYISIRRVADSRAVLSLGLSCVRFLTSHPTVTASGENEPESFNWTYLVQTYDILCACQDEYTIDPRSVKFLVDHGFDFNRQMALGLPYRRGQPLTANEDKLELRDLILEIIKQKIPLVCHNGIVDVVFLYRHFISPVLPQTLRKFAVDLHELFGTEDGGGIFDTKYIAEFHARMSVTYLIYLFRKFAEMNEDKRVKGKNHVTVVFPPYPSGWEHLDLVEDKLEEGGGGNETGSSDEDESKVEVCVQYALHGCCKQAACSKSHDIDDVLVWEKTDGKSPSARRRDRKRKHDGSLNEDGSAKNLNCGHRGKSKTGRREAHRAGYDAFMTAHVFAAMAVAFAKPTFPKKPSSFRPRDVGLGHVANRIFLSGKKSPLILEPSAFDRASPAVCVLKRDLGLMPSV